MWLAFRRILPEPLLIENILMKVKTNAQYCLSSPDEVDGDNVDCTSVMPQLAQNRWWLPFNYDVHLYRIKTMNAKIKNWFIIIS